MAVEDQNEATGSNTSLGVGNCSSKSDAQSKPVIELKEVCSFGNDHTPKIRKPYTITKQREKWTEDEHQKFLEALKLYGRGWRQIEEHVGTKTAVQIRSHAQKFFSKVTKESSAPIEGSGSGSVSVRPIEIPPPRPKRKPVHPYPRKSIDSLNESPERSPSPQFSVARKGQQSPTSVLSAAHGSDVLGGAAAALDQLNRSPTPTSCTTDMPSSSLSSHLEKENDYLASNSSAEEAKEFLPSVQPSAGPSVQPCADSTLEKISFMKYGSGSTHTASTEKDAGYSIGIKLFGRTVFVSDTEKQYPAVAEDFRMSSSNAKQENHEKENDEIVQTLQFDDLDTRLSLGGIVGDQKQSVNSGTLTPHASPPAWSAMHPTLPCFNIRSYDQSSVQKHGNSCADETMTEGAAGVDSLHQQSVPVSVPRSSRKGFSPYKRCLADVNMNSSSVILAEEMRDRQKARVCS